jgi:hypothetical protein
MLPDWFSESVTIGDVLLYMLLVDLFAEDFLVFCLPVECDFKKSLIMAILALAGFLAFWAAH